MDLLACFKFVFIKISQFFFYCVNIDYFAREDGCATQMNVYLATAPFALIIRTPKYPCSLE